MTAWWEDTLVGFDCETTHPDPRRARIVTASIAVCRPHEPIEVHNWMANPGVEIPAGAAAIHGISTERAMAEGRPWRDVIREVVEELERHATDGHPLVAFNARYDFTVADREARRANILPLRERDLLVFDPLVVDKHLDRYRPGSRTLEAFIAHLGLSSGASHEAEFDAVTACRAAFVLGKRGRVVRRARDYQEQMELEELVMEWDGLRNDLVALQAAQLRWAQIQARGLADHFHKSGKVEQAQRVMRESLDWPVIEYDPAEELAMEMADG